MITVGQDDIAELIALLAIAQHNGLLDYIIRILHFTFTPLPYTIQQQFQQVGCIDNLLDDGRLGRLITQRQ